MSYWNGYEYRPERITVTVVEGDPKAEPKLVLPNGEVLVPAKPKLGFDTQRLAK